MASTFYGLTIASSGLNAFQASINTIANNISNVQTTGYTRQTTVLQSAEPLRSYTRYGSTGSGVEAVGVVQERNLYYDAKYWQNNSNKGLYEQQLYYLDQIQELLKNDDSQEGFTTIFSGMFNALDTLKTNSGDESVRNQFIHQAQSLCTYFNSLSQSLTDLQEDCNEEIKSTVTKINSISEKIAMLNKEINMIELRGTAANELRDQRANLIDELSALVNVETEEYEIPNTYGENLGGTNYRVIINGQVLVDGNDYRTLDCVSADYKLNSTDIDGLYNIVWSDTGMDFAAATGTAGGSLKALFAVRDGNNDENMKGAVTAVGTEVNDEGKTVLTSITMEPSAEIELNALDIPEKGRLKIGSTYYYYEGWSAEIGKDVDGNEIVTSVTYTLTEPVEDAAGGAGLMDKTIECGSSVDAMGIPYYQAQINEFLRCFTQAFNDIEKEGVTLDDEEMGSFFVGETKTGVEYDMDDYDALVAAALAQEETGGEYSYTLTSSDDSYYRLTAATVKINDRSMLDPTYFSTATSVGENVDQYDIVEKLMTLQADVKMFRGDTAEKFLEKLTSDITVDVNKVDILSTQYTNLCDTIANQRTSVSGVDEDEEGTNLIKFQYAYNLASKMISVMAELYDKLINETGVT